MATLQISNPSDPAVRRRPRTRVYVRKLWSDDWQSVPYLEPITATNAAAPTMPSARLRWRAGKIKFEDKTAFARYDPLALKDWFVRIDVLGQAVDLLGRLVTVDTPLWYGVISDDGLTCGGTARGPLADQDLTAYGLEHLLDRVTINTSAVLDAVSGQARTIGHAIAFNEDYVAGFTEIGNRSAAKRTVGGKTAGRGRPATSSSTCSSGTPRPAWSGCWTTPSRRRWTSSPSPG